MIAIQDYSDFFHLERQKNFKPDDLSVKVAFGEIGQIIEGCIQPFARHILHLNYLSSPSDKHNDLSSIAALSLGDVITRLNFIPALSSLYTPSPWKITLSQWRNIAQHCAYEFVSTDGTVTCHYGRAPRAKSIFLQYDVIHDLCRCINDIYMFHKTADAILSLGVSDLSAKLAMKCLVTPCTVVSTITEVLHTNSLHVLSFDVNSTPWELLAIDPLDRDKVQLKKVLEAVALFTRLIPGCQILFVIKEKSSEKFHTGLLGLDPTTESTAISD